MKTLHLLSSKSLENDSGTISIVSLNIGVSRPLYPPTSIMCMKPQSFSQTGGGAETLSSFYSPIKLKEGAGDVPS
ncbi:unnamed protein product [marine sediment metagenome]|uniref:Uncharacterized protein n=1 Tax=marine sediment metagenome TaxID=412755 RepID=X0YFX8_9ZZZZ